PDRQAILRQAIRGRDGFEALAQVRQLRLQPVAGVTTEFRSRRHVEPVRPGCGLYRTGGSEGAVPVPRAKLLDSGERRSGAVAIPFLSEGQSERGVDLGQLASGQFRLQTRGRDRMGVAGQRQPESTEAVLLELRMLELELQ